MPNRSVKERKPGDNVHGEKGVGPCNSLHIVKGLLFSGAVGVAGAAAGGACLVSGCSPWISSLLMTLLSFAVGLMSSRKHHEEDTKRERLVRLRFFAVLGVIGLVISASVLAKEMWQAPAMLPLGEPPDMWHEIRLMAFICLISTFVGYATGERLLWPYDLIFAWMVLGWTILIAGSLIVRSDAEKVFVHSTHPAARRASGSGSRLIVLQWNGLEWVESAGRVRMKADAPPVHPPYGRGRWQLMYWGRSKQKFDKDFFWLLRLRHYSRFQKSGSQRGQLPGKDFILPTLSNAPNLSFLTFRLASTARRAF